MEGSNMSVLRRMSAWVHASCFRTYRDYVQYHIVDQDDMQDRCQGCYPRQAADHEDDMVAGESTWTDTEFGSYLHTFGDDPGS